MCLHPPPSRILPDMVQNSEEPRRRGRPRAYDPQVALQRATDSFWRNGYSATSLDEICAAVGMNRPSLYAAFGDKHTLYLKALEHYWQHSLAAMHEALADHDRPLHEALMRAYDAQLSIYFSGEGPPRGCFLDRLFERHDFPLVFPTHMEFGDVRRWITHMYECTHPGRASNA